MKKYIYFITPPILYLLWSYVIGLVKKKKEVNNSKLPNEFIDFVNKQNNSIEESIILGNGPSLDYYLTNQLDFFHNKTIFCVNGFVHSIYFEKLKPKYYTFYDPIFWSIECSLKIEELRNKISQEILKKVDWEMYILLPKSAEKWNCFLKIKNKYIKIVYFENKRLNTKNKEILFENYKNNVEIVYGQTVTVVALYLSLTMGSKINYVLGVDLDMHQNLKVINNVLHIQDTHFYNSNEDVKYQPFWKGSNQTTTFTMGEILEAFSKMFNGFYEMNEYANYLNSKVYNVNNGSFLDAFDIKELNETSLKND